MDESVSTTLWISRKFVLKFNLRVTKREILHLTSKKESPLYLNKIIGLYLVAGAKFELMDFKYQPDEQHLVIPVASPVSVVRNGRSIDNVCKQNNR